jgi:hypothetical protein
MGPCDRECATYIGVLGLFLLLDCALDLVAVNQRNKVAYRGLLLELELVDGCFIVLQVSAMQRASENGIRARAQREQKPSMGVDSALTNV